MTAAGTPLTERPAWKALRAHHREVRELHLRRLSRRIRVGRSG